MALSVIELMNQQEQDAKSSYVPFFLRLKDKQRAYVRPLLNLDQCLVCFYHHFYSVDRKRYVDAICAREINQPCVYCQMQEAAAKEKNQRSETELKAKQVFMLPLYLHGIVAKEVDESGMEVLDQNDNPVWKKLTYVDKETEQEKIVSGVRVIPLMFAKSALVPVASNLKAVYMTAGDIRLQDFIIERVGADQKTTYKMGKKQPAPFTVQLEEDITREWLHNKLYDEVAPPMPADKPSPAPLQGNNAQQKQTPAPAAPFNDDEDF